MKIAVLGYYGFGNLGDELILSRLIDHWRSKYPSSRFVVFSHRPYRTKNIHRVNAVSRWNVWAIIKSLIWADLLIVGGGGLIQARSSARSLYYYLGFILLASWFGKSVRVDRVGVDPFLSKPQRWIITKTFGLNHVEISVRDNDSQQYLKNMGLQKNVIVRPDYVLEGLFTPKPSSPSAGSLPVLLIPRFPMTLQSEQVWKFVISSLKKHNISYVWQVFEPRSELPLVQKSFLRNTAPLLRKPGELEITDLENIYAGVKGVISARYHGLVLAKMALIPFMGCGDPVKVGNLCDDEAAPFLNTKTSPSDWEEKINNFLHRISVRKVELHVL